MGLFSQYAGQGLRGLLASIRGKVRWVIEAIMMGMDTGTYKLILWAWTEGSTYPVLWVWIESSI
jgi:hypothetical protein